MIDSSIKGKIVQIDKEDLYNIRDDEEDENDADNLGTVNTVKHDP
jgi:hypothetical protein